ncbi:hypothetical protein BKN38_02710 [Helicobacter sp. CLO-3]|uniref:pyrroline-5-carboxylate reductase n=1 Tax=unclassified Helicobacter TaxID=2593540 RepID=UPI000804FB78|nr:MULTISPECIES: pyrroline-5-carboxylate reductase [unclassified Helicobacter]OBV28345.1 hypothetical protein BA723_02375 [Helicobacter sp. CLO-3]OHU84516.1 hypothetical protein BKN38_02710 [Helicobacter sp. CLO-3]
MNNILIIGYGNMAHAIALGISKRFQESGKKCAEKCVIEVCGRDAKKASEFASKIEGVSARQDSGVKSGASSSLNSGVDSGMDSRISAPIMPINGNLPIDIEGAIVILAIKSHGLESFIFKGEAHSVYSVLAGVNISTLKQHLKAQTFIRLMPNIGAKLGLSSTAAFIEYAHGREKLESSELEQKKDEARALCESFGSVVFVEKEELIDSAIATSGSSPAFLALIAQALIDSGVREGIKHKESAKLVQKTFEGVAKLLESHSPQEIIDAITTPGGTTIEGLSVLEERATRGAIIKAAHASVAKARGKI